MVDLELQLPIISLHFNDFVKLKVSGRRGSSHVCKVILLGSNKIGVSVLVVVMVVMVPTQLFFFLVSQTIKCSSLFPFSLLGVFPLLLPKKQIGLLSDSGEVGGELHTDPKELLKKKILF